MASASTPLPVDAPALRVRALAVLDKADRLLREALALDEKCEEWDATHVEELRHDLAQNCFEVHDAPLEEMQFYDVIRAERRVVTRNFIEDIGGWVHAAKDVDVLRGLIHECNAALALAWAANDEASMQWGRRKPKGDDEADSS